MNLIRQCFVSRGIKALPSFDQVALALFIVNFLLVFPSFFPNLSDIGPWDETAYINGGRMLVDKGEWPAFAGNPLAQIFYALTYLPFRSSPFWLVHSCTLGRILSFTLIWLGTYLVARQVKEIAHPAIALGMFLVAPFTLEFLVYASDPLFSAFAAFTLWQLLGFYRDQRISHLYLASIFLALAAFSRNDGLTLFPLFVGLSLLLGLRYRKSFSALIASTLPFVVTVGSYVLFYGIYHGDYRLGTMERAYDNFEAGQQILGSAEVGLNPVTAAKLEARKYFGTPEENDHSIWRAIRRNPAMYLKRLKLVIQRLPELILRAYGIRFAPILFLLFIRGVLELLRRRQGVLLLILLVWPMHLVSGFAITLFRLGHLLFPFYIVLVLAAIGLASVISRPLPRERLSWLVLLLLILPLSVITNKLAITYAVGLFLLALLLIYLLFMPVPSFLLERSLLVFLCVGLILHGPFPSPKIRDLGKEPREQAILALVQTFPTDTPVAAASLAPAMAKMHLMMLASADVPVDYDSARFLQWMRDQKIQAVYVDSSLYNDNPSLWALIEPQIGKGLERIFSFDDGDIQILRVIYP